MVDSVNSSSAARLRLLTPQAEATGANNGAQQGQPVNAVDQVRLSESASVKMAERLTETGPPFDAERVDRIRQAVAEGRYPIDAQRLTDSLFQDYNALMR